jgi:PI31 proteasome regulator N-terminal/PI31 proteasome regulator
MTALSNSALGAESLLNLMVKSLPSKASDGSCSIIKDPYAAIGLFVHACMLAVGFRLIGLGEDHKIGAANALPQTTYAKLDFSQYLLDADSDSQDIKKLPSGWDAAAIYAFRYAHAQSSMEYLLKASRLGGKALVFAVALPDDKTASFDIRVQDYVSEGSIKESTTTSDIKSALRNIFVSSGRMADLSSLFKVNIIQKLAPGIQKEGYEETSTATEQPRHRQETRPPERDPLRDDRPEPARPFPFNDPLAAAPRRPVPPGDFPPPDFEDEYEMNRPPRGLADYGGRRPLNIGERDLYPPGLGPHDPLRIGPGGGGFGPGGGMYPTFDDPLFAGQGGAQPYNPRAPPGARYDPVGPGDGPPNLRGGLRFPGGRGGGSMGGNPFGGFGSGDFI